MAYLSLFVSLATFLMLCLHGSSFDERMLQEMKRKRVAEERQADAAEALVKGLGFNAKR